MGASGKIFTWGDNKRGQCGQGEVTVIERPTLLECGSGQHPVCRRVSCGGFFTFFEMLADDTSDAGSDSRAVTRTRSFACGWGKEGCLGFGQPCKRMLRPQLLPLMPEQRRWTHLSAGMAHAGGFLT